MVVHLYFAAVLVTCYCHVHVFGSLIGLNTEIRGCTCGFCGVSLCALPMMNCVALEEMFSMHSTLFTLVMDPKMVFLNNLISVSAVFNIGIISSFGCLFLMLSSTSKGMRPLGSCLSKLISKKLLISKFCGILMEIHVIDLLCNVYWPLVVANCLDIDGAIPRPRTWFLMVIKCLPSQFQVQLIL